MGNTLDGFTDRYEEAPFDTFERDFEREVSSMTPRFRAALANTQRAVKAYVRRETLRAAKDAADSGNHELAALLFARCGVTYAAEIQVYERRAK